MNKLYLKRGRLMLTALTLTLGLVGCAQTTHLRSVVDLPLRDTEIPDMDWQLSPMRAHAQYILFGANSYKERKSRLGDYYFVEWYDGQPQKPVCLEMLYTQAGTVSKVQRVAFDWKTPRRSAGIRKSRFTFNGEQRAVQGDILTWRINLFVDGQLVDSRRSFLWQE